MTRRIDFNSLRRLWRHLKLGTEAEFWDLTPAEVNEYFFGNSTIMKPIRRADIIELERQLKEQKNE